eukprot:6160707-Amphidinium_carterae.1
MALFSMWRVTELFFVFAMEGSDKVVPSLSQQLKRCTAVIAVEVHPCLQEICCRDGRDIHQDGIHLKMISAPQSTLRTLCRSHVPCVDALQDILV